MADGTVSCKKHSSGSISKWTLRVIDIITAPFTDWWIRSYPKEVPDYRRLVLLCFLANPLVGILLCHLHLRAKTLFNLKRYKASDSLYVTVIIGCHLTIGLVIIPTVCLLVMTMTKALSMNDSSKVIAKCLRAFHYQHFKEMCLRNITNVVDFCKLHGKIPQHTSRLSGIPTVYDMRNMDIPNNSNCSLEH